MTSLQWLRRPVLNDPIAVIAFDGWGDAGDSASLAAERFVETLDSEVIAQFEPDEHYDFQVRRPLVFFNDEGSRYIQWPENEIHVINNAERDLVVMLGEEPNYRWKVFTNELVEAFRVLGVKRAVTVGAFVGQVAHTLPVPLIGSSTKPDSLSLHGVMQSSYQGPTGIIGVLNTALESAGIDVMSVWAAVPHYLSNQDYPPAVEALVLKLSELTGVGVDISDLASKTRQFKSTVDEALESNEELQLYVERLEQEAQEQDDQADRLVSEIEDFLKDR